MESKFLPSQNSKNRNLLPALIMVTFAMLLTTLLVAISSPSHAARSRGSLSVSPPIFVPGQVVHFNGSLPKSGKRAIHLQINMNRPGDSWTDVAKSGGMTNAAGRFDLKFNAPSMFNISYRVVGGGVATPAYLFYAKPQSVTLSVNGQDPGSQFVTVLPLVNFTIEVDTSPNLYPQQNLKPPFFPGRAINLQERVNGNEWKIVASGVVKTDGKVSFSVPAGLIGEKVYRARQENWTKNGNRIGWFASFPTYVSFGVIGGLFDTPVVSRAARTDTPEGMAGRSSTPGVSNASQQYGWGQSRYDFAWEYGQSLSSPPSLGTKRKGSWYDNSSGTGRVAVLNGALALQSKLAHLGKGDRGDTMATMTGNAQKYGRWEFRIWQNVFEHDGSDFRFRVELVPMGSPAQACVPNAIRVADMTLGKGSYEVGVRSSRANAEWSYTKTKVPITIGENNFAVEVGKSHITWFFNGRLFATMKGATQITGNLVPRLTMIGGDNEVEHNGSQAATDWVRAWDLSRGEQVKSGHSLARGALSPSC